MSKKTATIVTVILLFVFVVFSFMPCIIDEVCMKASIWGHTEHWRISENMFRTVGMTTKFLAINISGYFAIATIAFVLVGIIVLLIRLKNEKGALIKMFSLTPCAALLSFLIMAFLIITTNTSSPWDDYYLNWEIGWGFYILAALLTAAVFLSVLIVKGKLQEPKEKLVVIAGNGTIPDDLEKFKALLDKGVITQEEFDAKKKQLLKL